MSHNWEERVSGPNRAIPLRWAEPGRVGPEFPKKYEARNDQELLVATGHDRNDTLAIGATPHDRTLH